MDRRPIAFLLPHLGPGGAERKIVTLANGFAARGHDVDIVMLLKRKVFYHPELHERVRVHCLDTESTGGSKALRAYLRDNRPTLLACVMHLAAVTAITLRATSLLSVPIVILEGGMILTVAKNLHPIRYVLFRLQVYLLYRRAARIIVNAGPIATELIEVGGVPASRVTVIHNPSAIPVFEDREPADGPLPGWPETDAPIVAVVSRMDQNKDLDTAIRAFAAVRARRRAALAIIGTGENLARLQALVAELGLEADVHFLGAREKPWRYLRRAAVYVTSAQSEGFSNALIEAMAVGCPIVATDSPGGTTFVLEQGKHGALVPVGDSAAMAEAIERMIDAPTDPQQLIARARAFGEGQIDAYLEEMTPFMR